MCASLGMRKAFKTVINFPAMILTPAFSYWVFGPIENSSSCCKTTRTTRIGVSFLHSWINAGVTIVGQITYYYLVGVRISVFIYLLYISLGLHFISVLTLGLIQLLERCDKDSCCISSCCKSTIQRTMLDVDDPSRQILFRQSEDEREMDDLNNA